ncbi:hypothetical protein HF521_012615 [Silurus meridionalis]|uniref:Anaphylatoxin-like domain-containing protein n=1 Tax=Silurus meridionalis TaxID=175797 RepID=A0A8T0ADT4_SILME|nr:hypothetical protein HF521_012615 [Silurus meridionalis]
MFPCCHRNVLLAPNILRVGTDEKVFVEAQDYSGNDLQVRISIKNYPQKRTELTSASTTLTAANNFQSLVNIKIPDNKGFFSNDPLEKQYVYLQAQFPTSLLEKVVLVSFQSGYIFVQTDKSIYTPETTVLYRIFLLTPDLKPIDYPGGINVDIINPHGLKIKGEAIYPTEATIRGEYRIPELAKFGIWSIVVQYKNTPQKNFTAQFEVKEYVLPSFKVALIPSKPFFYMDDEVLEVEITAKYLFGKNVDGVAFVVFEVRKDDRRIDLPRSLSRTLITNGVGRAVLTRSKIQQSINNIADLVGGSLFISASVLTQTGSEMVKAEKGGIQIVKSPYTIEFKRTPKYFHPGMPLDVTVYATNPDQSPAENVGVVIRAGQEGEVRALTRRNGFAKVTVNTNERWSSLEITAKTEVPDISAERQAENKMIAEAYATKGGSRNYLHISADSAELAINDETKFQLIVQSSVQDQDLTYLIFSKGQIVKAERLKRKELISLSERITKDLVPSFRLVAYYHIGSEIVSDSIWVAIKDTCLGTLKLDVKQSLSGQILFNPGEEFDLVVTGDPSAKVGLVALDMGVLALNKNRLTQSKIWNLIENYYTGCTAGSGKDSMGVFYDAGLLFQSDKAGGTKERTGQKVSQTIEQVISGDFMGRLIRKPIGSGDQLMISMTLSLTATHYLDTTNQWEAVGLDRRNEAIQHITTGYAEELNFRKEDGSYAPFLSRPSSTWLTAYVVKVFAMASDYISIDKNVLCSAIKWLILNAQMADGTFKKSSKVIYSQMVGDVRGIDSDASLTAFVLIALQEETISVLHQLKYVNLCHNVPGSSNKALDYLERRLPSLTNPYAIAMTSYALANAGKFNKDHLLQASSEDGSNWQVPGGQFFSVEATAYALLALVKAKEFDAAGKVVRWLNRQSINYGSYGTTQATIIVFQAMAEYYKKVRVQEDLYLEVELRVRERSHPIKWIFNSESAHMTSSDKVQLQQEFNVTAKGTGAGVLKVMNIYYAKPIEKKIECKSYTVSVELKKEAKSITLCSRQNCFQSAQDKLVDMLQPAAVSVYEYYSPEERCVKFYHPTKKEVALSRLCSNQEGLCECAEENCSIQKKLNIEQNERELRACEAGTDYVYKVKVVETNLNPNTDFYEMEIEQILREGIDRVNPGNQRTFMGLAKCRSAFNFVKGKSYLLMGQRSNLLWKDKRNVLLAPNILHMGTVEKVFVEAQDYSGNDLQVNISIKDYPQKRTELTSASTTLTAANNFQSLVNIKIPDNKGFFSDDPLEKQYVYLQAQFPSSLLEKVVLVSFQSGYIFVQTDKSIYKPETTVLYRIFLLTPDLKPTDSHRGIDVDVINPHGLTIKRENMYPRNGIIKGEYRIPELAKFGIWSIVVQYKNTPQKNFTAQFEVKEYVLPNFEVALNPSKPFFYMDDEKLEVEITAKYLFGKNVEGVAFVVFEVRRDDRRIALPRSLSRTPITNGVGRVVLTRSMIQQSITNIADLVGGSLFISASVLTQTGSEMVKAEKEDIQIVKSPYTIEFKKTPKYFHPGMPFDVTVYATNPDQSPAENVGVVIRAGQEGEVRALTRRNGFAIVTVNTNERWSSLEITAKTDVPDISAERQAENKMIAEAYATKGGSRNYLHISADSTELETNNETKFHLNVQSSVQEQDLTYLILSKGQIVKAERLKKKEQMILSERITKDLVPSFRLVAYYHIGSEIVSDSIRVEVKDRCMGTLKLNVKQMSKKVFQTGENFNLVVTGDPGAKVGLVAVDKRVFLLNKNRLTQSKIWNLIEKYDTGCTPGSGKDSMGVFYDAGLLFQSDKAGGTKERTDIQCPTPQKRKRRELQITQTLVGKFAKDLKKCCEDGIRQTRLDYTCEQRSTFIMEDSECVKAFLDCCMEIRSHKDKQRPLVRLARSDDDDDYDYDDDDFISFFTRTHFPESWLWEDISLPACPGNKPCTTTTLTMDTNYLQDSITTWQILAISLSKTHGICAADPYEITVVKDFFVDLKLPYSAVHNEQVEIKAILYNLSNMLQKVRLEFFETEQICSVANKKKKYRSIVNIDPNSSRSVPFLIIPMKIGDHHIEVKAASGSYHDGVRKTLKVMPEGMLTEILETNLKLNPSQFPGGIQTVQMKTDIPSGQVPNTPAHSQIIVTGKKNEKNKHHYKLWKSTRLTAYVVKVFAMATDYISIDKNVLCSAIKWLILNAQMPDGTFKERSPVVHSEMVGDVRGKDSDASLTAFVLIALQEGNHLCATYVSSILESSSKALNYLERRLLSLNNPYAIAMTSYALAKAGKFNKNHLLQASSEDGSYWQVPGGQFFSVEATAYALLALVKAKEFNAAGKAVRWLNRQSINYGGHGTTQATIMVFQAVAEYYKQVSHRKNVDLMVEVRVSERHRPVKWIFNSENLQLTYTYKVQLQQEFNVTAKGTGAGVFKVMTIYYARPIEKKSNCKNYTVSLEMKREAKTSYSNAEESYMFTINVLYNDPNGDAPMTILDIGLLTGFVVDKRDLTDLSSENDKYIQKFEMNEELSERGSLIIYLDKVSHTVPDRIAFRMHKINKVNMLQPAAVSVYEYYSPEERCVKFYHPTKNEGALSMLCSNREGLCECAEENCSIQKKPKIKNNDWELVDYVYKAKVVEMNLNPNTDFYEMEIEEILREGIDQVKPGNRTSFMGRADCRSAFNFVKGKSYLLMGQRSNILKEDSRFGTWSIAAQYKYNPQKNFTAEFETKDYAFFYVEDETFEVEIIAKYLFGKNVDGVAFVVFGVRKDKLKIRLTGSLSREIITNGVGRAVLTKAKIQQAIPNINDLEGGSLFISVSVLTQTGSEMVEAEKGGIQIVKSPYTIEFKKTPKYFHPGMSFDVAVYVTNPDQSPAEDVDVVIKVDKDQREVKGRTKSNGMAKVIVNTQGGWKTVDITARTDVPGISAERQAQNKMIAEAYTTKEYSGNYLHISADSAELQINDETKFQLNFKSSVQDQDLTYLILSKGQIVKAERYNRKGQSLISLSERITKDLVPSFRLVAYYHVGAEIVSDSIWVDVKDTCMGTLKLSVKDNPDGKIFEPGDEFKLVVTGDPSAKVGLVAVDKGVFVLNKNRLTQSKIWNLIEKYDTGCTAGSGKDSMGVFYDAGLLFQSDKAGGTKERTDNQCPTPPKRKRRAKTLAEITQTLDDDDDFISSDEIVTRTQFPESWLWEYINLPACSGNQCTTTSITMETLFPEDSITTWQLLAISLSKTHGICVADPFEITVAKEFFVDLKLPYSAVHNEQVEIKAILYNFSKRRQMVRVEFFETDHICSTASKKKKYRTIVNVDPNSSRSVPFVIIPMKIGEHHIEVQAASSSYHDGVRRTLKVVPEGVLTEQLEANMELNPSQAPGGVQVVQLSSEVPSGQVPNTDAHTYITVVGQKVSQAIKQAISGDFMGHLIVQPTGSGEQNMIYMTLPLIATHYLDTTEQWEGVGLGRRNEAIQHITTGYTRELTYRKPDGSYAAWLSRPSSTWLTAYVAKVFAMASDLIHIEENVICSAIKWLTLNVQMPDGTFIEKAPVVHSEMVGDVQGKDSSASLTAFVLIALQESNHLCAESVGHLLESSNKALDYLESRLPSLTNPYAIAMTSYALANAGKFNKDRLLQASSEGGSYWEVPGGQFFSVEATAYALLALVKAKEFDAAGKVVRWLNRQSIHYGGHGTTQATIMVFQAVAEYYKQVGHQEKVDLMVEVSGVHRPIKWNLNNRNSHLTRSYEVQLKQKFKVTATGTGAAVLRVMTMYYDKSMKTKNECKKYSLSVEMKRNAKVSYTDAEESYELTIEVLYKDPNRDATMTILDIGLLTGFVVDKSDRTDLSSGNDKYIQMTTELSERGSLIIYLDKVSHTVPEIIAFSVHKINKVDMLQPAAVSVYEHNSPGERCVKFYHPTKKEGALHKLCSNQGGLCECAEEKQYIKDSERELKACDSDFSYVYKVKVVEMNLNPNTDFYIMEIEQILREGIDRVEPGNQRTFMGHADCRSAFNFVKGKSYLLMGQRSNLLKEDSRLLYILGEKTWIEYWPTSVEGQTDEYKETHQGITALVNALLIIGCVKT